MAWKPRRTCHGVTTSMGYPTVPSLTAMAQNSQGLKGRPVSARRPFSKDDTSQIPMYCVLHLTRHSIHPREPQARRKKKKGITWLENLTNKGRSRSASPLFHPSNPASRIQVWHKTFCKWAKHSTPYNLLPVSDSRRRRQVRAHLLLDFPQNMHAAFLPLASSPSIFPKPASSSFNRRLML